MKKSTSAILLCLVAFPAVIISCCKQYCSASELRLVFANYKPSDVDTVFLVSYQQNGQFNISIDSFYSYTWYQAGPDSTIHFIDGKPLDKDYTISIPSLRKTYRISDISKKSQHCNCGHGSIDRVGSYKVDGVLKQREDIVLQ